ncbi:MAG: hypothetical protein ACYCWW_15400 [Deltaproteobacteria bacterium]
MVCPSNGWWPGEQVTLPDPSQVGSCGNGSCPVIPEPSPDHANACEGGCGSGCIADAGPADAGPPDAGPTDAGADGGGSADGGFDAGRTADGGRDDAGPTEDAGSPGGGGAAPDGGGARRVVGDVGCGCGEAGVAQSLAWLLALGPARGRKRRYGASSR